MNVITLQKLQYFVFKLRCVLHILHKTTNATAQTTDHTTQNHAKLQTKLCAHTTHKADTLM